MNRAQLYGPLVVIQSPTRASAPAWLGYSQPLFVLFSRLLNWRYAKLCERDALLRGEHPYMPPESLWRGYAARNALERAARARSGHAWGAHGDLRVFYLDRGLCRDMRAALRDALLEPRRHVECRTLWPRRSWMPTDAELRALSSREAP